MRTLRAKSGAFGERPYYDLKEIEQICRAELMGVDLLPAQPQPIRIERFVEKRFSVSVRYDDLPSEILGFTKFGESGVREIVVSRSLSEDRSPGAERRVSTTIAHEAGHGLLHSHLFSSGSKPFSLFGDASDVDLTRLMCRDEENRQGKTRAYSGRWWEFQANQAMGALLLPRPLVMKCLEPLFDTSSLVGLHQLRANNRDSAVRSLSETFEVNPIVARFRLEAIFPAAADGQLTL
jgi:hypothetical protein